MIRQSKVVKKHKEFMFFAILFNVIRKNIKLISRSKSSSLIVILGPLIIIALVGAAYNTSNIYNIRVGAYSDGYSELADSILESLSGKQFAVIKFDNSQKCIDNLKFSQVHVCVIIPSNLKIGSEEPLDFHVDQSRVNLVWIIIDAITSKLSTKSSEISLQLTSSIIGTLSDTGEQIRLQESTLETLDRSSGEVLDKVNVVSNNLSTFDYDIVGAIDLGKISQKLGSVIDENNLSSGIFTSVFDTISNVKNKTEFLGKDLQDAASESAGTLEEVKSGLSQNKDAVFQLKNTLSNLKINIEGVTGTSAETVVHPIKTHITPVVVEKTHLNFLFPTLIVLIIMLISLLLSSSLIIREKTSSAFFRNYITPTNSRIFLLGHFLTNFFILGLQLFIIFIVASFFFKSSLVTVLWLVAIALIFIVAIFILTGMLIGYIFKSEETSMLATISLASLFLFFSSTILPLETLPESLKRIADFNPFVISEGILKKIMLFKAGFANIYEYVLILVVYILIISLLTYGVERLSKSRVE